MLLCLGMGCSFRNENLIDPTLRETELLAETAKARNQKSLAQKSQQSVEAARGLQKDREYEEAYARADQALLETRLGLALAELQEAQREDSVAAFSLVQEEQEKKAFQNILQERSTRGAQP